MPTNGNNIITFALYLTDLLKSDAFPVT